MSQSEAVTTNGEPARDRRAVAAWCLFDWANSAFPTVIVTFVFAAFFTRAIAASPEEGTALWGAALSASALLVAVLSPVLGAIADQGGRRKPWILGTTVVCVAASALLWEVRPEFASLWLILLLVAVGNAAFEFGQVFYNAMLPEVAPPSRIGRVSGWAWGLGYAGGLVCLGLSLLLFIQPDPPLFGLDAGASEQIRIIGPLVALWFMLFALPLFIWTPDRPTSGLSFGDAVHGGFRALKRTIKNLRAFRNIALFLVARMVYTDGLNTLFAFGGIYAAGTLHMSYEEILIFGIVLNVASGFGAVAFAWLDDLIGPKRTIIVALVGLTAFGAGVLLVYTKLWFYIFGSLIGALIGPAQSASRSMMARMAPVHMRTEMFGLYALSGKATAFIGPALVGIVTVAYDSQRIGMATILAFYVVGLVLLLPVREPPERGA